MDFIQVLNGRRSIRWFQKEKIDASKLELIVQEAQKTPSWVNSQPVRVVIAQGKTLERIRAEHRQLNLDEAVHSRPIIPYRPLADWDAAAQKNMQDWFKSSTDQVGPDWSEQAQKAGNDLYQAQAVLYFILPRGYSDWSLLDLGAFTQSIMLAAYNQGVDSLPAYQFVTYPDRLQKNLGLTADQLPVMGVGLGYADENHPLNQIHAGRLATDSVLKILD